MIKDPNSITEGAAAAEVDKKSSACDNILITREGVLHGGKQPNESAVAEICRDLQEQLKSVSQELKAREIELAEANATVKVLLRRREMDRDEIREKIVCAINEMIRPFLEKLANRKIGAEEKSLVAVLQQNLDRLLSPMPARVPAELGRLSPTEIQVIHLIRQGKASKEIAVLMGVAQSTVDFHRHNIRRKLRLSNTRQNLRTYLSTLG